MLFKSYKKGKKFLRSYAAYLQHIQTWLCLKPVRNCLSLIEKCIVFLKHTQAYKNVLLNIIYEN